MRDFPKLIRERTHAAEVGFHLLEREIFPHGAISTLLFGSDEYEVAPVLAADALEVAMTDDLTALVEHRGFGEQMNDVRAQFIEQGRVVAKPIFDLSHFLRKRYREVDERVVFDGRFLAVPKHYHDEFNAEFNRPPSRGDLAASDVGFVPPVIAPRVIAGHA